MERHYMLNRYFMGIKPFLSDKLIVRAFFLYPSVVQDDYPVGILDGFEPVGNGNDGASFNQRANMAL